MRTLAAVTAMALLWPVAAQSQSQSDVEQRVNELTKTYMLCVRRAAIQLEPSGDSPEDIGRAATWACANEEVAAVNASLQVQRPGYGPTDLRGSGLYVGAAQAVGARRCRKTKNCTYAHVP
jgi:hypothetical protein